MLFYTVFVDKKKNKVFLEENCEYEGERVINYAGEYPMHLEHKAQKRKNEYNQMQKRIIAQRGKR